MASADYNSRPLPAPSSHGQHPQQQYQSRQQPPPPPQQQQYQQQQQYSQKPQPQPQSQSQNQKQTERTRPRSRGFSFRSDKSQKTDKSNHGAAYRISSSGLHETSAEKESKRLHSKADPTLAMQEAEPSAIARTAVNFDEKPPLSSFQHKDNNGVVIADPDRSNPTRNRWERPLETIRSFEAAIDGGYNNRQSIYRADSESVINWNRRNSYYGNSSAPRFPRDSYYGGRPGSTFRPESVVIESRGGPGYYEGGDPAYGGGYNGGRNQLPRMQSEPPYTNGLPPANRNVYRSGPNQRSYETVASGSGSGSLGEPAGYQTDPTSSEDSSINRRSPPKRQEPMNDYGISFGQTSTYQPPALNQPSSKPRTMPDDSHAPPAPPPKGGSSLLRKASKGSVLSAAQRTDTGEKRKSWFSRRFSKSS